jgi:hypothetical protein
MRIVECVCGMVMSVAAESDRRRCIRCGRDELRAIDVATLTNPTLRPSPLLADVPCQSSRNPLRPQVFPDFTTFGSSCVPFTWG